MLSRVPWIVAAFIVNTLALLVVLVATDAADARGINAVDVLLGLEVFFGGGVVGAQQPVGGAR